jgi:peptidoglycan/LPS O-acetylase OafA/YrhL
MRYAPQLDGLRAICVALTILNHVGPHPYYLNGNVGVDVFFALSGFLITSLLVNEKEATNGVCLLCFYVRRFFRIVPLYYFTFVLYAISAYALYRSRIDPLRWSEFLAAAPTLLLFMGEYRPETAGALFGHSWTLGIEEKYYLLWPVLLLGLQRLGRRAKYGMVVGLIVISWVLLPEGVEARGYGGLAIGSLVALINGDTNRTASRRVLSLPTYAYLIALLVGYWLTIVYEGGRIHVVLTLAAALLICTLVETSSAISRVLGSRPLAFIGRRTYGIYLVHVLIANAVIAALSKTHGNRNWLVTFSITFGTAIVVASILKMVFEDRMIAMGRELATHIRLRTRAQECIEPRE